VGHEDDGPSMVRATVQPDSTRSAETEMLTPKVTSITIGRAHPSSQRRSR